MKGPFAIVCRGHSGSRLLCETFIQNGIWMGNTDNDQRDTVGFGQGVGAVRRLIRYGFRYPELGDDERLEARQLMSGLVEKLKSECPTNEETVAFGWKRPVTIFLSPILLDSLAEAKVIHLIRDGRDAMLSRLEHRMTRLHLPLKRLAVFGSTDVAEYRGRPLDSSTVEDYRNEIEMHHWVTAVQFGMKLRRYPDRYLEVRYEDLCTAPEKTMHGVFEFLEVPFRSEARDWVVTNASTRAIGKWRGREEELAEAIEVGRPLLNELGYT